MNPFFWRREAQPVERSRLVDDAARVVVRLERLAEQLAAAVARADDDRGKR